MIALVKFTFIGLLLIVKCHIIVSTTTAEPLGTSANPDLSSNDPLSESQTSNIPALTTPSSLDATPNPSTNQISTSSSISSSESSESVTNIDAQTTPIISPESGGSDTSSTTGNINSESNSVTYTTSSYAITENSINTQTPSSNTAESTSSSPISESTSSIDASTISSLTPTDDSQSSPISLSSSSLATTLPPLVSSSSAIYASSPSSLHSTSTTQRISSPDQVSTSTDISSIQTTQDNPNSLESSHGSSIAPIVSPTGGVTSSTKGSTFTNQVSSMDQTDSNSTNIGYETTSKIELSTDKFSDNSTQLSNISADTSKSDNIAMDCSNTYIKTNFLLLILVVLLSNFFSVIMASCIVYKIAGKKRGFYPPTPLRYQYNSRTDHMTDASGLHLANDDDCKAEELSSKNVTFIQKNSGWCVPLANKNTEEINSEDTGV